MTRKATFFRLLDTPISEKGTRLRQQIADLNADLPTADVFPVEISAFSAISGSPFAYWITQEFRENIRKYPTFEPAAGIARRGPSTGDDTRRLRIWWEVSPALIGRNKIWVPFPKGGNLSPYYSEIYSVVSWDEDRRTFLDFYGRPGREIERPECLDEFFLPGLTWPRRASRFSPSAMPEGCIFSVRGQAVIAPLDRLFLLMGVFNSQPFDFIFKLSLGRFGFPEFIAGVLQRLPWVEPEERLSENLSSLAYQCFEIRRNIFTFNELTHVFCLPQLLLTNVRSNLQEQLDIVSQKIKDFDIRFSKLQEEIDQTVAEVYGTNDALSNSSVDDGNENESDELENEEEIDEEVSGTNSYAVVSDFIMWCIGVAFGRWDIRYALNPETLPALPKPFDPLPVCSPGMLKGKDGLPLHESPKNYPLSIASHGFLVDDPDRPQDDIVAAVQRVLHLLFGANADSIENEACQILEVTDLRTWFRDPKGFFAWHIKRYSKSRRKAPIYWLIQSAKKNYAIWLYYPRLNPDSLFFAAREYADAKLNLENTHLEDLQSNLSTLSGSNLKVQEKKLAAQSALVAELKSYIKTLDAAALLQIKPDLNDGVLLNIAPLRELVPWKEPARAWDELLHGKYAWSHIAAHLRQKGLTKGA